jgi:hypothetical protein
MTTKLRKLSTCVPFRLAGHVCLYK